MTEVTTLPKKRAEALGLSEWFLLNDKHRAQDHENTNI